MPSVFRISDSLLEKSPIKIIGLTGGIATGKSTAARFFAQAGAAVVDADRLARRVTAPGTVGWEKIRQVFGQEFIGPDKTINRLKLGRLVFGDHAARKTLEAIIHPRVNAEASKEFDRIFSKSSQALVVYDVPLLFEANIQNDFDASVVVYAPEEIQKKRLMSRDGITLEEAKCRISSQIDIEKKIGLADAVLDNSCEQEIQLKLQVDLLIKQIWAYREKFRVDKRAPTL